MAARVRRDPARALLRVLRPRVPCAACDLPFTVHRLTQWPKPKPRRAPLGMLAPASNAPGLCDPAGGGRGGALRYFQFDWADTIARISDVTAANRTISIDRATPTYGGPIKSNARWMGLNLLSELDEASEQVETPLRSFARG